MIYVSWVAFFEGNSDRSYFEVLLPRVMEDIILMHGTRSVTIPPAPAFALGLRGRAVEDVAAEVCKNTESFHLLFVHSDTGGRSLREQVGQRSDAYCERCVLRCGWNPDRCVRITPSHETEGWALADTNAVTAALGYAGNVEELGLPASARAAERLVDPKLTLSTAIRRVRSGRRHSDGSQILSAIAQTQSFDRLREMQSFRDFEARLRKALVSLGCIPMG